MADVRPGDAMPMSCTVQGNAESRSMSSQSLEKHAAYKNVADECDVCMIHDPFIDCVYCIFILIKD